VIRLFEEDELKRRTGGGLLFEAPIAKRKAPEAAVATVAPAQPADDGAVAKPGRSHLRLVRNDESARSEASAQPAPAACDALAGLDDEQRSAAATGAGPLLILAGPGSGKTRTLTHRIAHLIGACGVAAEHCLAITFTRRAAAEMRERLARLLPDDAERIAIHTFHSIGLAILREHPSAAGLHRDFRIATEAERTALLVETLDLSTAQAGRSLRAISKEKRTQSWAGADAAETTAAYARAMALHNWIDFDDLIALAVRALLTDIDVAARCRSRFQWISVDEFQDVDEQQYRLLTLLTSRDGNLCVIGDPNQAIYGFRGADASCFDRFRHDHPAAKLIALKRNYRSTGTIVAASAQLMSTSPPASEGDKAGGNEPIAEMVRGMHERITIHAAATDRAEAESVVKAIEAMIGGHSFFSIDSGRAAGGPQANLSFADFAVLYRTDAQSAALCEAFGRSGIPYQRSSHTPLAEQPAVRALLDALDDDASGAALSEQLRAAAHRLEQAGDPGAVIALQQLSALAERCGNDRARLVDAVALATDAEFFDPRADRVSLLTLHAAKGLEFPVVFITGLEDGVLPLHWGELDQAALAEERRLFYVGMTRAKDRLVLSRAAQRLWRGGLRAHEPSPFLRDIESELVKHQRAEARRRRPDERQLKLL
jgi:ATP-dependent DNA helicase UvrD/PcrA